MKKTIHFKNPICISIVFLISTQLITINDVYSAEVFRSEDRDGNAVFSDTASDRSSTVEVGDLPILDLNTFKAPGLKPALGNATLHNKRYELSITTPKRNATLTTPSETLVEIDIQPTLSPEHKIGLYLDNNLLGYQTSPTFIITNAGLGYHRIYAQVTNKDQELIGESKQINFKISPKR